MSIKTIRNSLFIALALSATFLLSGCVNTPSLPIGKVEKNFQNEFDVKTLSTAIVNSAKEEKWHIIKQTPNSMSLKKTYTKSYLLTTPHERWRRKTVDNDVYVTVDINQKSLKMNLTNESENVLKNNSDRELFNDDLEKLEKAIYKKLTEAVL